MKINNIFAFVGLVIVGFCSPARSDGKLEDYSSIDVKRFEYSYTIGYDLIDGEHTGSGGNLVLLKGWFKTIRRDARTSVFFYFDQFIYFDDDDSGHGNNGFFRGFAVMFSGSDLETIRFDRLISQKFDEVPDRIILNRFVKSASLIPTEEETRMMEQIRNLGRSMTVGDQVELPDSFVRSYFTREKISPIGVVESTLLLRNRYRMNDSGSYFDRYIATIELNRFEDEGNEVDGRDLVVQLEFSDSDAGELGIPFFTRMNGRAVYDISAKQVRGWIRQSLYTWADTISAPGWFEEYFVESE